MIPLYMTDTTGDRIKSAPPSIMKSKRMKYPYCIAFWYQPYFLRLNIESVKRRARYEVEYHKHDISHNRINDHHPDNSSDASPGTQQRTDKPKNKTEDDCRYKIHRHSRNGY